jgi:hypothetical protein
MQWVQYRYPVGSTFNTPPPGAAGASSTPPDLHVEGQPHGAAGGSTGQGSKPQPTGGSDQLSEPQQQAYKFPYLKAETLSLEQKEELVAKLRVQSEAIQNKFAIIVDRTMESLEDQQISCQKLKALFKFSSYKSHCTLFEDGMSVIDLFLKLSDYWSFFDYELLTLIIERKCPKLRDELEQYISDLEEYCQRRIVEVPAHMLAAKSTSKNIVTIKYETEFYDITLNNIKHLQARLSLLLKTPLRLLEIEEGCTQLMFDAACTISPLTDKEKRQFPDLKIQRLCIKNPNCETVEYSETGMYTGN